MNNQAYLFAIFIVNGILIGLLFDVFRILRKTFKTNDLATYIQDVIFWILTGIITLYFIFCFNNGEIRFYVFLGITLGVISYILTISKYVIKVSVKILTFIKNALSHLIKMLLRPLIIFFKTINKFIFKPFFFIFINIRKKFDINRLGLSKFMKKTHKPTKNAT